MNIERPKNMPSSETVSSIESLSLTEIQKHANESPIVYLHRAEKLITEELKKEKGFLFDSSRSLEEDLSPKIIALIDAVAKNASSHQGHNNNIEQQDTDKILEEVRAKISGNPQLQDSEFNSNNFDTTQRNRKFFEIQPGQGDAKRETYWNTLFFQYNTEATKVLAKKILDDKEIILLGGGRSKLKKELQENNINPAFVLNIDPFVENPEQDADEVISLNACDQDLIKSLEQSGINPVDEIWAEYSVPAYLNNTKEIKQLFVNIDSLLKNGGTARIWPLAVGSRGVNDEEFNACKDGLTESIKNIASSGNYEISLYKSAGRNGLTLYKKNLDREKLQNEKDKR